MSQEVQSKSDHIVKYRADIDGLRAIAVLLVVGFHAFPSFIQGGFVGVDVFFVISGFLISGIIFKDLKDGKFDFLEFYGRRVRRIFPALSLVLISCLLFGWFSLLGDEYQQLSKHLAGAAGFISNYLYWGESGYFDNAAETKPLLHLWSLGIEEQFYIFWPFLLWICWKKRFSPLLMTTLIAFFSFALDIQKTAGDVVAAYFSPQTRFWELLAGAILASDQVFSKPNVFAKYRGNNKIAIAGLLLILGGAILIKREDPFPGWRALIPTIGACLLLAAGPESWVNWKILSNRALVLIGLISFPLYLWHWPILSFCRILSSAGLGVPIRIFAIITSFALAYLTWTLLEKSIRLPAHKRLKTILFSGLMVILGGGGLLIYKGQGLPFRAAANPSVINSGDIGQDDFFIYMSEKFFPCQPESLLKASLAYNSKISRCFQSKMNAPARIAIIGDSHAEHLFLGLAEAIPNLNIVYYIQDTLPTLDSEKYSEIFRSVANNASIEKVIFTAYWVGRSNQVPKGSSLSSEISKVMRYLSVNKKTVYLTDDVPYFSFDARICGTSRRFSLSANRCSEKRSSYESQRKAIFPFLEQAVSENANARIIQTAQFFCDSNECSMSKDGRLMYRDSSHLNINGSKFLGLKIIEAEPGLNEVTSL